jgi:hypothetical protein
MVLRELDVYMTKNEVRCCLHHMEKITQNGLGSYTYEEIFMTIDLVMITKAQRTEK